MTELLADQAIVITGAGRGIGRAYAHAAAAEGALLVVNDIDIDTAEAVVAEITDQGGRAVVSGHDVSNWAAAGELIELCVATYGRIDGLVNNAGELRVNRPEDQTEADMNDVLGSSLIGTIACTTHALPHMRQARRGVILNVTSGQQMGAPAMAVYGAAKSGIAALTYSWSLDLNPDGIRVNAISPNAQTRMADVFETFLGDSAPGQNEGKAPESNAPLAIYLLSELSAGVTGQVIRQDGQSIMVCSHPAVIAPSAFLPEEHNAHDVASAVAFELASLFQPVGVRRVNPPNFV